MQDATPSPAFLRVFNPVARALLRSRLGALLHHGALITFSGRRTGRTYEVVVTWHELDGQVYVVTPSRWRANFAGGAPMRMRHAGVEVSGQGVLRSDPAEVADVVGRLLAAGERPSDFALKIASGHVLTAADVAAVDRALVAFVPEP